MKMAGINKTHLAEFQAYLDKLKARRSGKILEISRRRFALITVIALLVLIAAGLWAKHAVEESLHDMVAASLQSTLDATTAALSVWVANELNFIGSWSNEPDLGKLTRELIRARSAEAQQHRQADADQTLSRLRDLLDQALYDEDFRGFAIVSPAGRVLAANRSEPYMGQQLTPEMNVFLERIMEGKTQFLPPRLKSAFVAGLTPDSVQAVIIIGAPIFGADQAVSAALIFTINPDQDFTRILSEVRKDQYMETYAFDRNGYAISETAYDGQLKRMGLIADLPDANAILRLQLRDPGGDLTQGFRTQAPSDQWPLTRMAAAATAGNSGFDVKGYRDFRGVMVLGAWRWLPQYGFGIATEVPLETIRRIMRPQMLAFWGLLALLSAATLAVLVSSLLIQRFRHHISKVKKLGQYTLLEKIGEGGMGDVYRARHALLKRPTAIKLLKPDALTAEGLSRFEREVQLTSRLNHPNTVQIYDFGHTPEGLFYYVMEYLPGITLDQLIAMEGPVAPARIVHILKHICYSLEEAHDIGLVHRDIKPPNIMLCVRGGAYDAVKVFDFGLVKDVSDKDVQLTAVHGVVGTPAYVAPERLTDPLSIDIRSDVYSLGALGFNLLTAKDVFEGNSAMEICYHTMKTPAPRPSEKTARPIPTRLEQLVLDCLAKDPGGRPGDMRTIITALDAIAEETGPWQQQAAQAWWRLNAERIRAFQERTRPAADTAARDKRPLEVALDGSTSEE